MSGTRRTGFLYYAGRARCAAGTTAHRLQVARGKGFPENPLAIESGAGLQYFLPSAPGILGQEVPGSIIERVEK
jgi:hypothetical protein